MLRPSILCHLLSAGFVFLGSMVARAQLTEAYFLKFQSPFMEIVTEGSNFSPDKMGEYPFWARAIRHDFFKWDPTGKSQSLSQKCDFYQQREEYLAPGAEVLGYLKQYFERCEKELQTGTNNLLANAYLTDFIKLHPSEHPYARHVVFHLPNGLNLKGLLALKGDSKPRPLVILRLGIFSNTREFFPERYIFLQMFEQSPFNMLILESMSGAEFLQNNTHYSLAGYDEGMQNYQVAKELTNSSEPLSQLIESVHLLGVSLGGHGVFYASILNELNRKVFSSFSAFCPLVQFQKTFEYHQSQGLSMWIMNYWARNRMVSMSEIFPKLDQDQFIPSMLSNIDLSYQEALSWDSSAALKRPPSSLQKGFFAKNNFWSDFQNIQTPFLIFATKKDPIVPFALNSKQLIEGPLQIKGSNPAVITLEEGTHCTLPTAYNWRGWTEVMQSYILKNSKLKLQTKTLALPESFWVQDAPDFAVEKDGLFILNGSWWNQSKFEIPLEVTPWAGLQKPFSSETQSMLRRWLQQNLRVRPAQDSKNSEIYWSSY